MKEMLLFNFPKEESNHSITSDLIKKFDLRINIIRASIDFNANGFLLVEVEGSEDAIAQGLNYLQAKKVSVNVIESAILIDRDKCVHCGACCAVCVVDALYMNEDALLQFDKDKCLDCKLCVTACPLRAIEAIL